MPTKSGGGGGRKRGRPISLTPEQKLENDRKRWRVKQARKRKAKKDAEWQRQTNFGYFVRLWVAHYTRLLEVLVGTGYLDEADKDIAPRIDAAADEVFENISYNRWWSDKGRPFGVGSAGTVRVRMTQELACKLADHEYAKRFPAYELRWADERVESCRRAYSEAKASAAREERKSFFLRVPPFGFLDDAERLASCLNDIRDAEAERDQIRLRFRTPGEFKEKFLQDRAELTRAAEQYLSHFCDSYVPDRPWVACNCKLALPDCDCPSRDRPPPGAPKPAAWPRGNRPLVKQSLYSDKEQRWWSDARYSGSKSKDDPIIRSHDKSANVGMKGFNAGTKGVWKNNNAEYYPEQDDRASTRDRNKTARDGEEALQRPYDNPEGTPKSWANPSDVEPDNEEVTRIGKRVIEDGEIEPYKRKKGWSEDDE